MSKRTGLIAVCGTLGVGLVVALMVGMSSAMNNKNVGSPISTVEITTAALTTAAITTVAQYTTTTGPVTYDISNDIPDVTTYPDITTEAVTTLENEQTLIPVQTLSPEISEGIEAGNIIIKPADTEVITTTNPPQTTLPYVPVENNQTIVFADGGSAVFYEGPGEDGSNPGDEDIQIYAN